MKNMFLIVKKNISKKVHRDEIVLALSSLSTAMTITEELNSGDAVTIKYLGVKKYRPENKYEIITVRCLES